MSSTGPNLNNLPSKANFYNKFDKALSDKCGCESTGHDKWRGELKNNLGGEHRLFPFGDTIASAYCCACKLKRDSSLEGDPCYFLYYYVGDKFFMGEDNSNIKDSLGIIYNTLEGAYSDQKCNINYGDVLKTNFDLRKNVHDFSHDYSTIKKYAHYYMSTDKSTYLAYLGKIRGACATVGGNCQGDQNSDPYCTDYTNKYKSFCEKAKDPQLTPNPNPNQAGSSGSFSDADLGDDLRNFPSKVAAKEIEAHRNNSRTSCKGDNSFTTKMKGALAKYSGVNSDIKESVDDIAGASCYICEKKKSVASDESPCYFVYYYLGNMMLTNSTEDEFKEFMSIVCKELNELPDPYTCKMDCDPADKTFFDSEGKVYSYTQDRTAVEQKLRENGPTCSVGLDGYLAEAAAAYGIMNGHCQKSPTGRSAYCGKFKTKYKQHNLEGTLISKCASAKNLKLALEEKILLEISGSKADKAALPATTSTGTTVAVPTVLTTIGLPLLGYFLYKHNLLPSWFGSHFKGGNSSGRRKKRSSAHHFDDTLTSDDTSTETSSTDMSTVYSTIGDSTEVSTIYSGPPRRENTNRREQQQQGQQRRRKQQQITQRNKENRNISYQNM